MGNFNKLLSIIIPTKNRYECLIPVVKALLKYIDSSDVEIIIQDNSDDNTEGVAYFSNLNENRVNYFHKQESLSMQDNTIFAINNSTGKYLIFIGDDDLVSPYIYEFVQYMDKHHIKCLVCNSAYYWWNTVEFVKENYFQRKEALWLPQGQSLKFEKRNSLEELEIMLQSGAGMFLRLPKLYHGVVKREVLEEIKVKTGTYLPGGSSPDIAFSTALSLVFEEYYFVNFPLTVFGASKNSNGGRTASNKHYGIIEEQKHLPKDISENWNRFVPRIWSEKTVYAQAVTDVLNAFKSSKKFNYITFYGTMLAYEPYLLKYLIPVLKFYCGFNLYNYFKVGLVFVKKKLGMWYRKIKFLSKTYDYEVVLAKDVDVVMKTLKDSKTDVSKLDTK